MTHDIDNPTPNPRSDHQRPLAAHRRALLQIGRGRTGLTAAACGGSKAISGGGTTSTSTSSTSSTSSSTSSTAAATAVDDGTCSVIPEETAGPYPGDGSNGVNVLTQDGVVRRDIRSSFGSA